MKVSEMNRHSFDDIKMPYSGPGWLPVDEIYPSDLRQDQKGKILSRAITQLKQSEGLDLIKKSKVLGRFRYLIRIKRTDRIYKGNLTLSDKDKRRYLINCRVFGERQHNKKAESRDITFGCSQYSNCPSCKVAYHNGKALDVAHRFAAVIQAKKSKYLRKGVFTLPENIRDQLKTSKQMAAFRARAVEVVNKKYGCGKDHRRVYKNGMIGIRAVIHPFSSHEPFKDSPHFHVNWLALILNGDEVINADRNFNEDDLRWFHREWAYEAKKEAIKQGLKGAEDMPDDLVVKLSWVPALHNLAEFGQARLRFWYDERSQLEDLEDCVKAVDLDKEMILMRFQRDMYDYFAVWSIDDYMTVQDRMLKVKGNTASYGFLRRFKAYAPTLGVKVWRDKDDFKPITALTERIQFKRRYESRWNKDKERAEIVEHLYVTKLTDQGRPESWKEVDPWTVRGEMIMIGSKQRYLYGIEPGRSPPDRGG